MDYVACTWRKKITLVGADGVRTAAQQCTAGECPHVGQNVTPEQCATCPVRAMLARREKRRAPVPLPPPPPTIPIITRDKTATEQWPLCDDRNKYATIKCCGQVSVVRRCKSKAAPQYQKDLTPQDCVGCQFRRAANPAAVEVFQISSIESQGCNGDVR